MNTCRCQIVNVIYFLSSHTFRVRCHVLLKRAASVDRDRTRTYMYRFPRTQPILFKYSRLVIHDKKRIGLQKT